MPGGPDRGRPAAWPTRGAGTGDRGTGQGEPVARATAGTADACAVSVRTPSRCARRLPAGTGGAGRAARDRAVTRDREAGEADAAAGPIARAGVGVRGCLARRGAVRRADGDGGVPVL